PPAQTLRQLRADQETVPPPFIRHSEVACGPPAMPGLSEQQVTAIQLLVVGRADGDVAAAVGINRTTLWRWKHHHPLFRAELSRRRNEVWASAADRFRGMLGVAIKVIRKQLRHEQALVQFRAAALLRTAAGRRRFAPHAE